MSERYFNIIDLSDKKYPGEDNRFVGKIENDTIVWLDNGIHYETLPITEYGIMIEIISFNDVNDFIKGLTEVLSFLQRCQALGIEFEVFEDDCVILYTDDAKIASAFIDQEGGQWAISGCEGMDQLCWVESN